MTQTEKGKQNGKTNAEIFFEKVTNIEVIKLGSLLRSYM